ncbi:Protein sidekick-2, partial [Geodia barretti]
DTRSGISASGTSHTLHGLEEGTEYFITVTATLSGGDGRGAADTLTGGGSAERSITASTMTAAPSAPPTDVVVTVESSTSIAVQWGPVECRHQNGEIAGYLVRYGEEGSSEEARSVQMVSGDSSGGITTVSGLNRQTIYTVQVAAVTSCGTGEYSHLETIETPDDVFLRLNGTVIPNNGLLNISGIGSTDDTALLCITNRPPPSGSFHSGGDWFSPERNRVQHTDVPGFTRNRGPMVVRLKRTRSGTPTEGIYHSVIQDSTSTYETVNVGLYNSGGGIVTLSGGVTFTLDSDSQFTLTCISTGGPATTVTWTRDSTTVTQGTQTVLNDPVTARYTHTLLVRGRREGTFTCTVANNHPSQSSAELTVTAPSPPSNVSVSQNGPTSLLVT